MIHLHFVRWQGLNRGITDVMGVDDIAHKSIINSIRNQPKVIASINVFVTGDVIPVGGTTAE